MLTRNTLFGVFVVKIFLGSIITGWHYLIGGLAGIPLAWGCYALTFADEALVCARRLEPSTIGHHDN